ncbi:SLC13 family permease [Listeria sp. PSOL-1]|uniref:SLC13 family permease n=1 Tax=Listeria sp. PSOL-1 TaxID=1844999 RepID=UPI0013D6B2F0|nr:SLC13 family permease [Listeria sp. PSOL-1]
MILTNDVALLSLIPIFIMIVKKVKDFPEIIWSVVLLIIAANLGSVLLPFGNPQNLFLFAYYHLSIVTFLRWLLPLSFISLVLLFVLTLKIPLKELTLANISETQTINKKAVIVPVFLFIAMVLTVLKLIPYFIVVPLLCIVLLFFDRTAFRKIDYRLLLTFVFFFLIVGNLMSISLMKHFLPQLLTRPLSSLIGSAIVSQLISNVPAAILIAPFSAHAHAVLLGVNIGGIGTLIASVANLIGFRIFSLYFPNLKAAFWKTFSWINGFLLAILLLVFSLLV